MSWETLLDRRVREARAEIVFMAQLARLEHGISPRIYLSFGYGPLPDRFRCPECGGKIHFEITDWEPDGQAIDEDGVEVWCPAEMEQAENGPLDDDCHAFTDWRAWRALNWNANRWARRWIRRTP